MSQPYEGDSNNQSIPGIKGTNSTGGNGIFGDSAESDAIVGFAHASGKAGVLGLAPSGNAVAGISDNGTGVFGQGKAFGIVGTSTTGEGVHAHSDTGNALHGDSGRSDAVVGLTSAAGKAGVLGLAPVGNAVAGISDNGTGVFGQGKAWGLFGSSRGTGVRGDNQGPSLNDSPAFGVTGTAPQGVAVAGENNNNSFPAIHGRARANDSVAVVGQVMGNDGRGIVGLANGANSIAIYGQSNGGLAGYFSGDVLASNDLTVSGTLTAARKLFQIDHPTDPKNRILVHCSVESSELLNIYSGTVETNADGKAVVQLPDYFDALNTDVRYQLTVIKQFAQAMVAEEVKEHRFSIATDKPNVKVSWQLTAVRQDSYALAHPLIVEQQKFGTDARARQLQDASPVHESGRLVTRDSGNMGLDFEIR